LTPHPFGRHHSGSYAGGALGAIFRGRISQARPHLGRSLRAFFPARVFRIAILAYTSSHRNFPSGTARSHDLLSRQMLRDEREEHRGGRLPARNVLGEPLELCSIKPMTGFYRDGCCNTGREDIGSHSVCAVMTDAFLTFSKSGGNDLSTPVPEIGFAGLKAGDRWCLCAQRWQEAFEVDSAPRVVLRATHEAALAYCALGDLKRFAVDLA
jgi:uncharacterized protein